MDKRTKHIHLFGIGYSDPQLSNILSRIYIGICNIAAVWTAKVLAISIANTLAHIAGLTRIARVNCNKGNANKPCLVFKERTELSKSPRVMSSSLCFPNSGSFPDMGQILNSNPFTLCFGFFYNLLCYGVIGNSGKSPFSTFEPFQKLSASCSAFALNRFTHLEIFISNLIQLFRAEICSIGERGNIIYSKIHPYKFLNILNILFGNFNRLKKIELALLCNKVSLTFDIRQIFRVMANKGDFQSAINRPDRNRGFFIGKNARIVCYCTKRLEPSLDFLVKFISVNYFTNTSDKHLSRKPGSLFQGVVNKMVSFKLIENFFFPYHIGNLIAGNISFFKSCQKKFSLFIGRQKFYLQGKFHNCNLSQILEYVKKNLSRKENGHSSPLQADGVSCPKFYEMDLSKIKMFFSVIKEIPEAIPTAIKIMREFKIDAMGPDEKGSWHIIIEPRD